MVGNIKRIRLRFANNVEVEFIDRDEALRKILEWAEKGVRFPQVVFGPEGCGKTAWLRQGVEVLKELGFDVIYMNPLEKTFYAEIGVEDVKKKLLNILMEASETAWGRAVSALVILIRELLEVGRKKIAILIDDAFQVIGLDKAAIYVKGLLGLIEYPPRNYDAIVAIVATSEGQSKRDIGRHNWADLRPIWNMAREGFKELYDQIPGGKPPFDEAWKLTGGNPRILSNLYQEEWNMRSIVKDIIRKRDIGRFIGSLSKEEIEALSKAVENPDVLMRKENIKLLDKLVELNLIIDNLYDREQHFWIDTPPPEMDLELGIGKYVAWQSPIHREAVRKVLDGLK